ncbi:MAG: glycosyltransferase family 2 protein [Leucobacter sp.]
MPRLSVLIPAYNVGRTVVAAVRSTLRDLPPDAEVVVLDDGSDDGTAARVAAIPDFRVRVISRPNAGVAATLNELIEVTDSELIARMDADDVVLPGRFGAQLRALDRDSDAVFTTVLTFGSGAPGLPRPTGIAPADFGMHLLLTNPVSHPTLLARRAAVIRAGGYRDLPAEDYDLWIRMATGGARLRRIGYPGLAYRLHSEQVTASMTWRRASWANAEQAVAFSRLAEQLIGTPATRITALSVDRALSPEEKMWRFDEFSEGFRRALQRHLPGARRSLNRRLAERRSWLLHQVTAAAL